LTWGGWTRSKLIFYTITYILFFVKIVLVLVLDFYLR
jgi:hypothetical protein